MYGNTYRDYLDDTYELEAMEHDSIAEAETAYEADRFWEAQQLQKQQRWLQSHRRGFDTEEEMRRELLEAEADRMAEIIASIGQPSNNGLSL